MRPILLFGREFWTRLIDFELLVETGMISPDDLKLFHFVETAEEAWALLAAEYGYDLPEHRERRARARHLNEGHETMNRLVSLIGAPTDIGAGQRGASMGPEALRVAGIGRCCVRHGLDVVDRGNLGGPANPWQPPVDGYRHLDEVVGLEPHRARRGPRRARRRAACRSCSAATTAWASARSARSRAIAARRGKKLRMLWLDAHADFNTNVLTPSGNIHGMPVACLCGFGPQELIEIGGKVPAISPKWIRQIGIRSVDAGEKRLVHEAGLEVFDMRYIDEMGMRHTMELALATIDANTHLHVSFDVDFLDADIAPGVGTTVKGGPTYREAQLCMEMIADTGALGSLDVMELNPALDVRNHTAEIAVDLIESLFGKSTLMRR